MEKPNFFSARGELLLPVQEDDEVKIQLLRENNVLITEMSSFVINLLRMNQMRYVPQLSEEEDGSAWNMHVASGSDYREPLMQDKLSMYGGPLNYDEIRMTPDVDMIITLGAMNPQRDFISVWWGVTTFDFSQKDATKPLQVHTIELLPSKEAWLYHCALYRQTSPFEADE